MPLVEDNNSNTIYDQNWSSLLINRYFFSIWKWCIRWTDPHANLTKQEKILWCPLKAHLRRIYWKNSRLALDFFSLCFIWLRMFLKRIKVFEYHLFKKKHLDLSFITVFHVKKKHINMIDFNSNPEWKSRNFLSINQLMFVSVSAILYRFDCSNFGMQWLRHWYRCTYIDIVMGNNSFSKESIRSENKLDEDWTEALIFSSRKRGRKHFSTRLRMQIMPMVGSLDHLDDEKHFRGIDRIYLREEQSIQTNENERR